MAIRMTQVQVVLAFHLSMITDSEVGADHCFFLFYPPKWNWMSLFFSFSELILIWQTERKTERRRKIEAKVEAVPRRWLGTWASFSSPLPHLLKWSSNSTKHYLGCGNVALGQIPQTTNPFQSICYPKTRNSGPVSSFTSSKKYSFPVYRIKGTLSWKRPQS